MQRSASPGLPERINFDDLRVALVAPRKEAAQEPCECTLGEACTEHDASDDGDRYADDHSHCGVCDAEDEGTPMTGALPNVVLPVSMPTQFLEPSDTLATADIFNQHLRLVVTNLAPTDADGCDARNRRYREMERRERQK